MNPTWQTADGSVRLYHGKWESVIPSIGPVDAVVSDPPYGINYEHRRVTSGKWTTKHHGIKITGDAQPFDPTPWLAYKEAILWGGNHFASRLPPGGWLVWDKRRGVENVDFNMSDG